MSVASKGRSRVTQNRPLQLLYPLEINHSPDPTTDHPDPLISSGVIELENVSGGTDWTDASEKHRRPQRASAKKSEERRTTWIAINKRTCTNLHYFLFRPPKEEAKEH